LIGSFHIACLCLLATDKASSSVVITNFVHLTNVLLLARLMGQYCYARWRLSLSVVVVCNSACTRMGGQLPPGRARGRSGGRHCTAGQ